MRILEREELQHEVNLTTLRAAIDEDDDSGIAEDGVFERVRKILNLPASQN